jgi:hypothetical protein
VSWAEFGEDPREAQGTQNRAMFLRALGSDYLPRRLSHRPTAATGIVMQPAVLQGYARRAGFAGIELLPIEDDFFRFYRPA